MVAAATTVGDKGFARTEELLAAREEELLLAGLLDELLRRQALFHADREVRGGRVLEELELVPGGEIGRASCRERVSSPV